MNELIKHHINEVMDMHCLTKGKMGYSVVYYANDVDAVIAELKAKLQDQCISCPVKMQEDDVVAEKDNEIRRLKRALFKALANWADVVAFENTEGIGYDNSVAERWRKMESKCRAKAEANK